VTVPKSSRLRNVTIRDVAKEANVSYSTVSRVLNNNKHVRPDKRQMVLDAVSRLGYVVNQQARSLAGGSSEVIGLLVPDVGTMYTGQFLLGIDETLAKNGYDIMLHTTHNRVTKEAVYINRLSMGMTDGLLLLLPIDTEYLRILHDKQFPYVVIDNKDFDDFSPTVGADGYTGACEAMRYLLELGHRRIGHITGRLAISSGYERLQAYRDTLAAYGIAYEPELVVEGDYTQLTAYHSSQGLLDLPQPPTAIFAANDEAAFGVLDAIRNRGLTVPGDISLVGFDNIPQAELTHPALTTVHQPIRDMGRVAAEMLMAIISNPDTPTRKVVLETKLVIRASCSPPKTANHKPGI